MKISNAIWIMQPLLCHSLPCDFFMSFDAKARCPCWKGVKSVVTSLGLNSCPIDFQPNVLSQTPWPASYSPMGHTQCWIKPTYYIERIDRNKNIWSPKANRSKFWVMFEILTSSTKTAWPITVFHRWQWLFNLCIYWFNLFYLPCYIALTVLKYDGSLTCLFLSLERKKHPSHF